MNIAQRQKPYKSTSSKYIGNKNKAIIICKGISKMPSFGMAFAVSSFIQPDWRISGYHNTNLCTFCNTKGVYINHNLYYGTRKAQLHYIFCLDHKTKLDAEIQKYLLIEQLCYSNLMYTEWINIMKRIYWYTCLDKKHKAM